MRTRKNLEAAFKIRHFVADLTHSLLVGKPLSASLSALRKSRQIAATNYLMAYRKLRPKDAEIHGGNAPAAEYEQS